MAGAGVISDVFIPAQRGTAYGFFYVGPLCGPVIGTYQSFRDITLQQRNQY